MAFIIPLALTAVTALASTAGAVGSTVGAAGTALSVAGGLVGTATQVASMRQNAVTADNNAAIAHENAGKASEAAQKQQIQSDNEIAAFMGNQEAVQSASGLSVDGRSQLLTRRSTAAIGRQDATNIIEAGRTKSDAFIRQADDLKAQAGQLRSQSITTGIAGTLGAIGTGLSGYASLAGRAKSGNGAAWSRYNNTGGMI